MRNKGFFWFFTIVLAVVCIYQLSFTFIANGVESEAEANADASVEEMFASAAELDTLLLPNGTKVAKNDSEARDLAKSAFVNDILKNKNEEEVFLGSTYKDVKGKSIALGLDLKGGMSVTLQLSMPDLVKNYAVSPKIERFSKPFNTAVDAYNAEGGDFITLFAQEFKKAHPERPLIKEFSTEAVIGEIGSKATDEEVINYLTGLADNALDGVETIMANRINQFGVAQPNITKDVESNRIYIELPGVKDQETVRSRIQGSANLEFYHALKGTQVGGILNALATSEEDLLEALEETETNDSTDIASSDSLSNPADSLKLDDILGEETEDLAEDKEQNEFLKYFRINASEEGFLPSPQLGYAKAVDTAKVNQLIAERYDELGIENVLFAWGNAGIKLLQDNDTLYHALYALEIPEDGKARVGGADIDEARVGSNEGKIVILVDMTSEGQEEWKNMTSDYQPRGNQPNDFEFVAIAMDGKVFSAPSINSVIEGGSTEISGNFKLDEAQEIVNLLNGGALPAPVVIVEEAVVGPTIGAENASSGLLSFGFALALVLIYMIFYYGKAGVVADIALVANIIFILGCLASFGAVLTLAGIAGIVLTIGMSVDANVLIFERIREEVAEGKGMKLAVKDGYKKALSSILDANVTTLLVAFVLKSFGSGPIESFASTLIIGIFTSVFAAVVITRLIFEWQLSKNGSINFSTKLTKGAFKNLNFKFIKNRKKFYIVSGLLVILGLVAIFTRELKPSVEFSGGRSYEMLFDKQVGNQIDAIEKDLRAVLVTEDGKKASVEVKSRNSDFRLEIATDFLSGVPQSETRVQDKIKEALNGEKYGSATIENSRSVSAGVSEELKSSSYISIFLSLIIIFVYILIRFGRWQYGLGALLAMAHDVIIVLGVFAGLHGIMPFNMEVDQAFIAAILTVVGYSINDTVVVFDRIREYLAKYRGTDRKEVINTALNSTLSRTINTSLSTFVVLLTIFIFDSGAIKGFVFALMIGVVVGTYSSICIATPAIVDLVKDKISPKKKEEATAKA